MFGSSYKICRVHGIAIRAHVTLLAFLPLMALYFSNQTKLPFLMSVAAMILFFASIALHELGHAYVAMREGCGVRQILLLPIGGIAQLSHLPARPAAEIRIAVAGPLVSLGLAVFAGLLAVWMVLLEVPPLAKIFTILSAVNLGLLLFNMLPSFPMDGGRVLRAVLSRRKGRVEATRIASKIAQWMAGAFLLIGLFRPDLILAFIAVFIFFAARSEYRAVRWEDIRARHPGLGAQGPPPIAGDNVVVGPPPFSTGRGRKTATPLHRRS